jgi:maltose O-acetyltransferase
MKALREIGLRRALRFGAGVVALAGLKAMMVPQLRAPWLRLWGARVGPGAILHGVSFFNLYRRGFPGFTVGRDVFVGDDCLFDLAEAVTLEDQVTLAERVLVLTHLNVGFSDHPLQRHFPAMSAPVTVRRGSFVGANVTVLAGVTIGPEAFVAAGSVVTGDVPPRAVVAGVPARTLRLLEATPPP